MDLSLEKVKKKIQIFYDQFRGLDFLIPIQPENVGFDPRVVYRSSPSGNKFLENILKELQIKNNDSILDIGCGKGSAMRVMHKFPFKRIDGLEISDKIAKIAINNFKILQSKKTEIFVLDAIHFDGYERYNFIYLYNPFPNSVMKLVLEKIIKSLEKYERELIIIYNNPTCREIILNSNIFKKYRTYPDEWGNGITIFSNFNYRNNRLFSGK